MKRSRRNDKAQPDAILQDWRDRTDALVAMTGSVDAMKDEAGTVLGEMYHRESTSEFDKQAICLVWGRAQEIADVAIRAGAAIKSSTVVHEKLVEYWQQVTCELDALQAAIKRGDKSNDLVRSLADSEYFSATADLHADVVLGVQSLTGVRHWPAALALVSALLSPDDSGLTGDELAALRELVEAVMLRIEAQEAVAV